jgi:prepilin-type N-terminal cleavage/methylation domain-containing protein
MQGGVLGVRSRTGVTLVELMITVAILSIGVLAAIGSFKYITLSIQGSKTRTLANNLAQEQIEKLKNLSYYTLLVTTSTYSDTRFSPALDYDTGNYAAAYITEGGIKFTRASRVDFAFQNGTTISTASWTSNDTGLKLITTYVIWQDGNEMRYQEMRNLMANPAANPLNASFTGTVHDTAGTLLPGAYVQVIDNPNWFGITNSVGVYRFNVSQGSYTLQCSSTGFFSATTPSYQSVTSGNSRTVDFNLGRMSSGTVMGYAYINDHLMISQVVGSSFNASGFEQEYVELFNPSSYTWTIASNATTPVINLMWQKHGGGGAAAIACNYYTLTIQPGHYYLFANTTTITAGGVVRSADAEFTSANAGYPNLIPINTDPGNDAGSLGIKYSASATYIDSLGWTTGANDPPFYETTALNQAIGLENAEQYVRYTDPTGYMAGHGNAYDSNNNNVDFTSIKPMSTSHPPHNSSDTGQISAGTPATGAMVSLSDGLSTAGTCNATTLSGNPVCLFNIPSVATGTWIASIASSTYFLEINTITVVANTTTLVPNATTVSAWPVAGYFVSLLNDTTNYAFLSGTVLKVGGTPLSGIVMAAGGKTTTTSSTGRYLLGVPAGDVQIIANYNNANRAYTSQSSPATPMTVTSGQLYEYSSGAQSTWFTLSLGGILSGYFQTGSNTPLPGRVAVAISGGTQMSQAVSGTDGHFYLANLSTGTYTIQPSLDTAETSSPLSVDITLSSTGTATSVSTFTITNGLSQISGQVLSGATPITTGVLLVASTATLSGGAASMPPPQSGSDGILCDPCYYTGSSDSAGLYTLYVRSSATPYQLYGWYTTYAGNTPTTTRAGPYAVTVSTTGMILSQNLTW